ncbi:mRNA-binding ribosome synthesis protein [Dermatophagoides farinae]|uniref:Pescadillo homolog n=1 Tax=Dermatophagoides farinae TaxID=6954 RepID=A0A922HTX7_DERFA|nr:pescadillo-like [Dermatophagoides farinae]KAH9501521.1 mRNA-binding ribosome synthesis protein [Dermatophagoides farinae]
MARNIKGKKALKKRPTAYMTRSEALQKLQLSLKDFRRLCILKGVYPVEAKKTKSQNTSHTKTYYLRKDILYLSHEPIIWRFWDFKIFMKRMAKAKGRRDKEWIQRIRENKPFYKLDHIVKERYPTIIDALRDMDDALSMGFLYAMFGKSKSLPLELIELSRRFTLEFMYYVMETKSLRKCFISIKGYYYEANIMGQTIRWIVPHQFVMKRVPDVDFQVMKTFTEFYVTLLGFVIYKLYVSNSFIYPPKFFENKNIKEDEEKSEDEYDDSDEIIAALNHPLINRNESDNQILDEQSKIDNFETELANDDDEIKFGSSVMTFHQLQKLQNLFAGLKFFINREVPREALCFVIRSFSGQVSWDRNLFNGATFNEDDESITHQIVDREIPKRFVNRYYIQPQWIFDSINSRKLLPVQNYFIGTKLPPHLSPFVEEKVGDYIPPEKEMFENPQQQRINDENDDVDSQMDEDVDDDDDDDEQADEIDNDDNEDEEEQQQQQMMVKKGKPIEMNRFKQSKQKQDEEKRLRVMMMPKKRKKLYDLIIKSQKKQNRETERLQRKRQDYDERQRRQQKSAVNNKKMKQN